MLGHDLIPCDACLVGDEYFLFDVGPSVRIPWAILCVSGGWRSFGADVDTRRGWGSDAVYCSRKNLDFVCGARLQPLKHINSNKIDILYYNILNL